MYMLNHNYIYCCFNPDVKRVFEKKLKQTIAISMD